VAARLRFLELMLGHAERGGVEAESPYRQHFTRWVFATARQFASAGHLAEARRCMDLADRSAGSCAGVRKGFGTFRTLSRMMGTRNAGRLLVWSERLRRPGRHTLKESFARDLQ
jgi:hypothetical protein